MIYLDYAANTPVSKEVLRRYCEISEGYVGNANSKHIAGLDANALQDRVTASIADMLGVLPEEVIYTSGATESNNLAIKGIAYSRRHYGKHIITTPLEHASVSAPLTALVEQGYEVDMVNIARNGQVDTEHLRALLRKDTTLVTVSSVDSELGTIQPIAEIRELLASYPNASLHLDATQAIGKIPVDLSLADTVSLSPHKFYGLQGSGILVKRADLMIEPLLHGGASTTIFRSGTPTVALNAAAEVALSIALEHQTENYTAVKRLNEALRRELADRKHVTINSPENAVPHMLNISIRGVPGRSFQQVLSDKGVCVSVKSACSTDKLPSRAVFAVSRDRKTALSSWRISLSHLTSEQELSQFLDIFDECCEELIKDER